VPNLSEWSICIRQNEPGNHITGNCANASVGLLFCDSVTFMTETMVFCVDRDYNGLTITSQVVV